MSLQKTTNSLQRQCNELKEELTNAVNAKNSAEATLAEIKESHAEELKKLTAANETAINELKAEYAAKLEQINGDLEATRKDLVAANEKENKLVADLDKARNALGNPAFADASARGVPEIQESAAAPDDETPVANSEAEEYPHVKHLMTLKGAEKQAYWDAHDKEIREEQLKIAKTENQ